MSVSAIFPVLQNYSEKEEISSDILSSSPYSDFLNTFEGHHRHYAAPIALWLIALAKPKEQEYIPEVLEECSVWIKETKAFFQSNLIMLIVRGAISLLEKVHQSAFNQTIEGANCIALEIVNRAKTVFFHGTHCRYMDSISQHGLSIEHIYEKDDPQVYKIDHMGLEILNKQMLFGYRFVEGKNVEGKEKKKSFFLCADPALAVSYAKCAPEWVSEFFQKLLISSAIN